LKKAIIFLLLLIFQCSTTIVVEQPKPIKKKIIIQYQNSFQVMVTAYCPGPCCNDQWAGVLANGKSMQYYFDRGIHICAVDPRVIRLGSVVYYNGINWLALDTGGKVKGRHIDILLSTHAAACNFGVKYNQRIIIR